MKEMLKTAKEAIAGAGHATWEWIKAESLPLMTIASATAVTVALREIGADFLPAAIAWGILELFLAGAYAARRADERRAAEDERGKLEGFRNVRRMTKRRREGVVVDPADLNQALALLADMEDYLGK